MIKLWRQNTMMIKRILFVGGLVCAVALTGCGSRQFTKGQYDENVEDTNLLTDKWSESSSATKLAELIEEFRPLILRLYLRLMP